MVMLSIVIIIAIHELHFHAVADGMRKAGLHLLQAVVVKQGKPALGVVFEIVCPGVDVFQSELVFFVKKVIYRVYG
jgi:hypothetical protein